MPTPLPTPSEAVAELRNKRWSYMDLVAILALLLAAITLLEQHGVLGGDEVEPASAEAVETDS